MATLKNGFFKVEQSGGSFITATFFNPETKEEFSQCVADADEPRRDDWELYKMDIDKDAKRAWKRHHGVLQVGDVVEVFKGRKVPIGTKGIIKGERFVRDRYGRCVALYVVLDNGYSTNVDNCRYAG